MSSGAPSGACSNLMPLHNGAISQPANNGYFIFSDAVTSYTPGQQYLGKVISAASL